jgi:hypothetical protein
VVARLLLIAFVVLYRSSADPKRLASGLARMLVLSVLNRPVAARSGKRGSKPRAGHAG